MTVSVLSQARGPDAGGVSGSVDGALLLTGSQRQELSRGTSRTGCPISSKGAPPRIQRRHRTSAKHLPAISVFNRNGGSPLQNRYVRPRLTNTMSFDGGDCSKNVPGRKPARFSAARKCSLIAHRISVLGARWEWGANARAMKRYSIVGHER